ncbi:thioredoxin family protein [Longibacter salinarum]|uniref:Thioredoxin family protein n=1 Tax=Longibacter salinarum TaxID=1850348 RepID=A0A2A8D2N2_9BACT|nr:thioredoxin family protein [Longibacter salinarum]PEN15131.1 thioredoxin family protein [Longibacter salinarum]
MKDFFEQKRPHDGFTYLEYKKAWKEKKDRPIGEVDREDRKMLHYLRYNWERSQKVEKAFSPSEELSSAVSSINEPQLWMVITEPWCGDSAFSLPVIKAAADTNDNITLRILHRDDNLDVMDQYLTGGSRSIPKLVAFDSEGNERFTWGPRPENGQRLFNNLREQGRDKMEIIQELIAWYEGGGYETVGVELADEVESHLTEA